MKYLKFLFVGLVFGIILTKSEVISWFRIYEMFRFESFHMYGVIGSAVILGALFVQVIKITNPSTTDGKPVNFRIFDQSVSRYLLGGIIFGLGWAFTGACPGPLYILIGNGYSVYIVAILSALLGTLVYGMIRKKLPH